MFFREVAEGTQGEKNATTRVKPTRKSKGGEKKMTIQTFLCVLACRAPVHTTALVEGWRRAHAHTQRRAVVRSAVTWTHQGDSLSLSGWKNQWRSYNKRVELSDACIATHFLHVCLLLCASFIPSARHWLFPFHLELD